MKWSRIGRGRTAALALVSAAGIVAAPAGVAAAQSSPGPIGPGSSDTAAVTCVQRALGVDTQGAPYGTFGAATAAAVRAFQSDNGLPPIGSVGPATGTLLAARAPAGCAERLPSQASPARGAGTPAPERAAPAAPRPLEVVVSPDIKVVRYLQVGARDCTARLLVGLPPLRPEAVPLACGLLDASSNPTPPSSLAGDGWRKFVASEEFRGFSHIPPMQLTCRDGRVDSVERQSSDVPFGVSPGWTFMNRWKKRVAEKAEWYQEEDRFRPDEEETRRLEDGSGVIVSARQASRIAVAARTAQFEMLGFDAPFIWSVAHVVLRCDGSVGVIYGGSTIPGTKLYVADRATSSIAQSTDLARFVRAGGRDRQQQGRGELYDQCDARQVDVRSGSDEAAIASCDSLKDDGGLGAKRTA